MYTLVRVRDADGAAIPGSGATKLKNGKAISGPFTLLDDRKFAILLFGSVSVAKRVVRSPRGAAFSQSLRT